ncbi:hypothetical protein RRG08_020206 [Elysia crispata]|uniref:Uncharacterized protein n=1 Tax=Elysia crispata TaxID=231223 RepID=A0AAE1A3L3_9GAST|nr:hypothetical protein RRG08_020206 [Elysia crispata]
MGNCHGDGNMAAILQNGGVIILSMEQIVSRNGALLQDLCLKLVLLSETLHIRQMCAPGSPTAHAQANAL